MGTRRAFLGSALAGAATLAAAREAGAVPETPLPPLQRGVALGLFSEDELFSYRELLTEIRELGTTHVALTVAYYQDHGGSTEIYRHPRFSPPEAAVVRTIREVHALGMKVLLFPILRLLKPRKSSEWRGTLKPDDPPAWWRSYGGTLLDLATVAAREGVAALSVGSEFSTLDVERTRPSWQPLVQEVRKRYAGLLTYSGNWDHYSDVAIYDLVDLCGLCAYFPLADRGYKTPAAVAGLRAAWERKKAELLAFQRRIGRPLLLTEVGYLSQTGAAAWPWQEDASEPVDLEDQRRCYEAFVDTWTGVPELRGVYFWNYYGWGGRVSRGYTPRRKPASDEIIRYFAAESKRPAR